MKKLMVALSAVALAAVVQASTVSWAGTAYGVDAAGVLDNGNYAAETTKMKGNGSWTYVISILDAGGTEIGHAEGTPAFGSTGKFAMSGIDVGGTLVANQTYDVVITLTGTQTSLSSKPEQTVGDYIYNYSGAQLETELVGTVTGKTSGDAGITVGPSSWTVSGITKTPIGPGPGPGPTPTPTPEPTSGLLLLLGVAGLALRRKQK